MDDLISRKAVIDLLNNWSGGSDYIEIETDVAIKEIQQLPYNGYIKEGTV